MDGTPPWGMGEGKRAGLASGAFVLSYLLSFFDRATSTSLLCLLLLLLGLLGTISKHFSSSLSEEIYLLCFSTNASEVDMG